MITAPSSDGLKPSVLIKRETALKLYSGYAKMSNRCVTWAPKRTDYQLTIGVVEKIDTWRCVEFSEVP